MGEMVVLGMYSSTCWPLLNVISFGGVASPTFPWDLGIDFGSPGWHGKHLYPSHCFLNYQNHRAAMGALGMFWLVSWHHFGSSSHMVMLNCSDGQRSEIVFSFVLLVQITGHKLHFPNVDFYIQS